MVKFTLCLGVMQEGDRLEPILREISWPVMPSKGSRIAFEGNIYEIMNEYHDMDSGLIRLSCLLMAPAIDLKRD